MKNLILVLLIMSISQFVIADPWDNMTKTQAEATAAYLKQNPYFIDYCDCCDSSGEFAAEVFLMKALSVKVLPSDWSDGDYRVVVEARRVKQFPYMKDGINTVSPSPIAGPETVTITMNYTWVFNHKTKLAGPLFEAVAYDKYDGDYKPCQPHAAYPNPFKGDYDQFDRDYKDWYRLNVQ